MAKKRNSRGQRDTNVIASAPLLSPHGPLRSPFHHANLNLILAEDLRTHHPEGRARPMRGVTGGPVHTTLKEKQKYRPYRSMQSQTKATVAVAAPNRVVTCIRRRVRREVLMAIKPRLGHGRRRRSWRSLIRC